MVGSWFRRVWVIFLNLLSHPQDLGCVCGLAGSESPPDESPGVAGGSVLEGSATAFLD